MKEFVKELKKQIKFHDITNLIYIVFLWGMLLSGTQDIIALIALGVATILAHLNYIIKCLEANERNIAVLYTKIKEIKGERK